MPARARLAIADFARARTTIVSARLALAAFALPRVLPAVRAGIASRRGILIGRILLVVAALAALPAFIAAVVSISTR